MKKLVILYLPEWKLVGIVKTWKTYLTNVGADINLENDNVIITWENGNATSAVHHIIDVCNDVIGDEWWIGGLIEEIKDLGDDFTIIYDNMWGNFEIR